MCVCCCAYHVLHANKLLFLYLMHPNCVQEIQAKMSRLESVNAQLDAYKDLPAVSDQLEEMPSAAVLPTALNELFLPVCTAGHWAGPAEA